MSIIKRFFDSGIAETGGTPNIAALMAQHGVKNDTDSPVATPIEIEVKEQPKQEEVVTPAATATEPQTPEAANPEPQQQQQEPIATPEPQKAEEPVKVQTLQEVLKNHQPDIVLKELGLDDKVVSLSKTLAANPKMVAFFNTWEQNGDVEGYLRELTTDYGKMSAEDVMRHQLRDEYPKASEAALSAIYEDEIVERYKLDPERYSEAEVERGRLLLEAKADNYRDKFISRQEEKLLPKAPQPEVAKPDLQAEQQKQEFERYRSALTDNTYTKSLFTDKKIYVGEGDEKFGFPVEPAELIDVLFSGGKWMETMSDVTTNTDGSKTFNPKAEHQMLVAAVAKYGKQFLNEYAKHYKSLGGKSAIAPIDNAKEVDTTTTSTPEAAPKNAAEAMARGGQYNSGGYNR